MTLGGTQTLRPTTMWWVIGGVAVLVAVLLTLRALPSAAASDRYKFVVRGQVLEVNHGAKTVRLYAQHTSAKAKTDLQGVAQDYTVKTATFYKWSGSKKKRVTFTKSAEVNDEVILEGVAKDNGQYNVTKLTVNERSFEVVGKVKENNLSTKTLKILVGTSTYKQSTFVDKEILIYYDNSTKFKSAGKDIDNDDVPASSQKAKVVGKIEGNDWKATKVFDNYP